MKLKVLLHISYVGLSNSYVGLTTSYLRLNYLLCSGGINHLPVGVMHLLLMAF